MANYKGIEIKDELAQMIRYMSGVNEYQEVLARLQASWETLTLLGQLTGTANEMAGTREAFQKLTGDLLNHLGIETRNKALADLRAKAQNSIDILVRNLFERTADIGFLATDDDLRDFIEANGDRQAIEARFKDYVAKYSVYQDIILFSPIGEIIARLSASQQDRTSHSIIETAISTPNPYVEQFGQFDFLSGDNHLVYAFRVESSQTSEPIGVLVFDFKLADEMQGIFSNLLQECDWSILACVDENNRVIASSSKIQLPVGEVLPLGDTASRASGSIMRFAGREYLAVTSPTHGYQGYMGPGWIGVGMIPLEHAFNRDDSDMLRQLDESILAAVMNNPSMFSTELRNIPVQAECIQQELNRSVWNGSVRQSENNGNNASFSKTLLWEISNAGRKTQAVFDQSIGNLHQTVVAAILQKTMSHAAFAIDVMDRNLYERANDCRWWALNATFRKSLAESFAGDAKEKCTSILKYINGLYTVYDSLVIFNSRGVIVATSGKDAGAEGKSIGTDIAQRVMALGNTQQYVVSRFEPSPLYANRHTYIYGAAIMAPGSSQPVGGIGIVFDAAPQFEAMLQDALPSEASGGKIAGAFTLFADEDMKVIASTTNLFKIGAKVDVPFMPNATGTESGILQIAGEYYATGIARSAGYREYKRTDGYRNKTYAICCVPLGAIPSTAISKNKAVAENARHRTPVSSDAIEIATFHIMGSWLGVPSSMVVEAIGTNGIQPPTGSNSPYIVGFKMYNKQLITVVSMDRLLGNTKEPLALIQRQLVIIKANNKTCFGLLVDSLGDIPEVSRDSIQPIFDMGATSDMVVSGYVKDIYRDSDGDTMLSIMDVDRLCRRLGCSTCITECATESSTQE